MSFKIPTFNEFINESNPDKLIVYSKKSQNKIIEVVRGAGVYTVNFTKTQNENDKDLQDLIIRDFLKGEEKNIELSEDEFDTLKEFLSDMDDIKIEQS